MSIKDNRVEIARQLIEAGHIKRYSELFRVLPLTAIITLLRTNHARLIRYNNNPDLFSFRQVFTMAKYLEIPEQKMIELMYNEIMEVQKKKKRPSKKG